MARNIEIKARLENVEEVSRRAIALCTTPQIDMFQHDIFFNVPWGRLKLRYHDGEHHELIFYQRSDVAGPKQSTYARVPVAMPHLAQSVLSFLLGIRGEIKKYRSVFLLSQTRVHIDRVEDLGCFVELEVVLTQGQSPEEGTVIAKGVMQQLGISDSLLVEGSYLDLKRGPDLPAIPA